MQSTIDRFAWPVVLALLLATIATIATAQRQDQRTSEAYRARDHAVAKHTAEFVSAHLRSRVAEQADFVAANVDAFRMPSAKLLRQRIENTYLRFGPTYVVGAVVTTRDGTPVVVHARRDGVLDEAATMDTITAIARGAAGGNAPVVSGRIELADGEIGYAHAAPLSRIDARYGAFVAVYDVGLSSLGAFFGSTRRGVDAVPTVLDDRGGVLAGPPVRRSQAVDQRRVDGSTWHIVVPATAAPAGIPGVVLALLLVGILLLGAIYWLQEGTRRALGDDARNVTAEIERLYNFAARMLHGKDVRDLAEQLARSVAGMRGIDGVRVRIARDRDQSGIVAGHVRADAHVYRLAITGPRGPLGEVLTSTNDAPLSDELRRAIQAMGAMAGAAMHTMVVLERERASAQELQRLDELRTNLLSTVAHELRSPLTAVKGVLGLLSLSEGLDEKQKEYVSLAAERTDALVALIRDLFDVSLIETGQLKIRPQRRRADELLQASLGAMATSRPDELFLSSTPNLNITVDPLRFDQVLNNLVTNAFRHGEAPVDVLIRPYTDGACLIVSDSGPGIPQDERDQVFSKFYQSDSGHARLVEGAGLGLSLVHGLVRLHGGRIEIDSTRIDGHGARFTIFFPDVAEDADFDLGGGNEPPEDDLDLLRQII